MDGATPLNTPPATDRGLSEAEREAIAKIISPGAWEKGQGFKCRYRDALEVQASALAKADAVLALLAAARREGGIASRDHDHSTDTSGAVVAELVGSRSEVKELLRFALLSTTAQIAKDAMPFIRRADAAIQAAALDRGAGQ